MGDLDLLFKFTEVYFSFVSISRQLLKLGSWNRINVHRHHHFWGALKDGWPWPNFQTHRVKPQDRPSNSQLCTFHRHRYMDLYTNLLWGSLQCGKGDYLDWHWILGMAGKSNRIIFALISYSSDRAHPKWERASVEGRHTMCVKMIGWKVSNLENISFEILFGLIHNFAKTHYSLFFVFYKRYCKNMYSIRRVPC